MHKLILSVLMTALMMIASVDSLQAAEFDGKNYSLDYPAPTGSFDLAIVLPGLDWHVDAELALIPDMPGVYLADLMDDYCNPEDPDFDPFLCAMLHQLFNSDAIAWLNTQWNNKVAIMLSVLPHTVTTRQLPWPADILGSLIMHDYDFEWPCSWTPASGEFQLLPFHIETSDSPFPNISINQIYDLGGNGQISRTDGYRIAGVFHFSIGTLIQAQEVSIGLTVGLYGEYTALPQPEL